MIRLAHQRSKFTGFAKQIEGHKQVMSALCAWRITGAAIDGDHSPVSQERIPPRFGEEIDNFLRPPKPPIHLPTNRQTSVQVSRLIYRMPSQDAAAVLEQSPYGLRIRVRFAQHFTFPM